MHENAGRGAYAIVASFSHTCTQVTIFKMVKPEVEQLCE